MAIITEDEVRKVYTTAPAHVKKFIDSNELFDIFYSIQKTHDLHVDQAGNLAMLIDAIVLEMHPLVNFPQLLKDALGNADDKTYQGVMKDVNDKVFALFRAKTKARADAAQKVVPAPVPPPAVVQEVPKTISVIEQKMSGPSAPEPIVEKVAPPGVAPAPITVEVKQIPPSAPAKYHGSDPYREPAE